MSIGYRSRFKNRTAPPSPYGPPAPYPFQRNDTPRSGDLRNPPTGGNPKYLEQKGGVTDFQRMIKGMSLPGFDKTRHMRANPNWLRAARYLGFSILDRHPAFRLAHMAFDIAYELDWNQPYAKTKDGAQGYDLTGYQTCCQLDPVRQSGWRTAFLASGNNPNPNAAPACDLSPGIFCGLSGQVPHGKLGEPLPALPAVAAPVIPGRYNIRLDYVFLGPANEILPGSGVWRMSYDKIAVRRRVVPYGGAPLPAEDPIPYEESQPQGIPLPPLTPPRPVWQETPRTENEPKLSRRWRQRFRRVRPYMQPSINFEMSYPGGSSGGAGASGSWPETQTAPQTVIRPREDIEDEEDPETWPLTPPIGPIPPGRPGVHYRLPPPRGTREIKGYTNQGRALALLAALYDKVTEFAEVINIIYDTLPREHRCPGARSISAKMNCIYANLEHVDVDAAVLGIIRNHFEDRYIWGPFYGKMSDRRVPFGVGLSHPSRPSNFELSQRVRR